MTGWARQQERDTDASAVKRCSETMLACRILSHVEPQSQNYAAHILKVSSYPHLTLSGSTGTSTSAQAARQICFLGDSKFYQTDNQDRSSPPLSIY